MADSSQSSPLVGPNPISFRGVTFASIEHPTSFNIGTREQKLTIAELPGGSRVVRAYGPQLADVVLNGRLFDTNVAQKISALQGYADDGQEGLLSWSSERYYAIAHRMTPGYIHDYRATFELVLTITRKATQDSPGLGSADQQASNHYASAYTQLGALASTQTVTIPPITYPQLSQSVTAVGTGLASTGPLNLASSSALGSLKSTIGAAILAARQYAPSLGTSGTGASAIGRMINSLSILKQISASSQTVDTVSLRGGSLFDLCASRYGDVSRVPAVMALNNLASPILSNAVTQNIRFPA